MIAGKENTFAGSPLSAFKTEPSKTISQTVLQRQD